MWREISPHLEHEISSGHPWTKHIRYPKENEGRDYFLKVYSRLRWWGALKDLFRVSRALRALRQGEALVESGFHVPVTVAAGEARSWRFLNKAFLLTSAVDGSSLPVFLRRYALPSRLDALRLKREGLKGLASEVRRLHHCGFVHGDLVPSNILVRSEMGEAIFFFIDNDRTRRYPPWLPHSLWKRNLVQLNRFVLPGISLQDRMRFLKFYLGGRVWTKSNRRLIRWLEQRTRKRRRECEQIETGGSFRELMRWNGPFARSSQ